MPDTIRPLTIPIVYFDSLPSNGTFITAKFYCPEPINTPPRGVPVGGANPRIFGSIENFIKGQNMWLAEVLLDNRLYVPVKFLGGFCVRYS